MIQFLNEWRYTLKNWREKNVTGIELNVDILYHNICSVHVELCRVTVFSIDLELNRLYIIVLNFGVEIFRKR